MLCGKKTWYRCPICGQKILKVNGLAKSQGLFIKCKKCKNEIEIKIDAPLVYDEIDKRG